MITDLHCHSNASDGSLSPTKLVQRAVDYQVDLLALTDHDTVDGLAEAERESSHQPIRFICGTELSVTWQEHVIHIVGLNIDFNNQQLASCCQKLQDIRESRAQDMAAQLNNDWGLPDIWQDLSSQYNPRQITRSHFADYLLGKKVFRSKQDIFSHYLTPGKAGFVDVKWISLAEAVEAILIAGGIPVLAHPAEYKLSNLYFNKLIEEFIHYGGLSMEVINGNTAKSDLSKLSHYCNKYKLHASLGSDFHKPVSWVELGRLQKLPKNLNPVWELF